MEITECAHATVAANARKKDPAAEGMSAAAGRVTAVPGEPAISEETYSLATPERDKDAARPTAMTASPQSLVEPLYGNRLPDVLANAAPGAGPSAAGRSAALFTTAVAEAFRCRNIGSPS